jgi:FhuF 2Fe-2S C-terminal domain
MPDADPATTSADDPVAAELAGLGPFFGVRLTVGPGPWRPLRDLLDEPVLADRVRHVRTALARLAGVDIEPRVAASTMSLGLFARLASPVLAAAILGLSLPRPTLDDTWWQPVEQGPWPLALTGPDAEPAVADLLTDVLAPLAEALGQRYSLSQLVLAGNIASAVFGALRMIATARPELAAAAREIGATLLTGPLAGTGELREGFVRSSCCLYYRIPGGGYCGDCVLADR